MEPLVVGQVSRRLFYLALELFLLAFEFVAVHYCLLLSLFAAPEYISTRSGASAINVDGRLQGPGSGRCRAAVRLILSALPRPRTRPRLLDGTECGTDNSDIHDKSGSPARYHRSAGSGDTHEDAVQFETVAAGAD